MAESEVRIQHGRTYRVEIDGIEVEEFEAKSSRTIVVEGMGGTSAFLAALPGRYEPQMRDTYTARPIPPVGTFREHRGKSTARVAGWSWLLEQPPGTYFARYAELGEVRITLA